jgi:hypothetical protein
MRLPEPGVYNSLSGCAKELRATSEVAEYLLAHYARISGMRASGPAGGIVELNIPAMMGFFEPAALVAA